jgi:excisionase family DNA binding protein
MVLSVKEMAALLGCSEQAVYRKVYRRALPYRKMGRKVIVTLPLNQAARKGGLWLL